MADEMVRGYQAGKADCRKGIKDKESYNSQVPYGIGYNTGWDCNWYNDLFGVDAEKPKLFAVILVVGDYYGGVDTVECLETFNTQLEAEEYIERFGGYVVEIK